MKRIDDDVSRRMSFRKRRAGLLKKARELAALCDADVGLLVFSDCAGKPLDYCSPHTSWNELIQRYESIASAELQEANDDDDDDDGDQMFTEIAALRRERDRLEASLRRQTGEDLPSRATKEELDDLDQRLEWTLGKVREMKDNLLNQQLDESRRKMHILEDQNNFLRHMDNLLNQQLDESHRKVHILEDQKSFLHHMVTESGQHRAAVEAAVGTLTPVLPFGGFFPEVEEQLTTSLQLWPQQLPDVQGFGLQPSVRLW